MTGQWDAAYAHVTARTPYGPNDGYAAAAEWVAGLQVEDWGCGLGWMRYFIPADRYRGIDGSRSFCADEIVDLSEYRSTTEAIVMCGVLEHNLDWRNILHNALASYTRRMVIVLFTPLVEMTHVIRIEDGYDVPTIAFRLSDLIDTVGVTVASWHVKIVPVGGEFGYETLLAVTR